MKNHFDDRLNLVFKTTELWRPILIFKTTTAWQRMGNIVRRFFDLQAGSIWRDLAWELSSAEGALLDVGCGAQPYRVLVPRHVQYKGIDSVDSKSRFGYEIPDTLYYSGNQWPVGDRSVDFVLCTEVLEHVQDLLEFLNEMHRCLKPGGRVLMTAPFAARWHFIPFDYWRFTPSGLKYLLEKANFLDIEVYARGNPTTVFCYKGISLVLCFLDYRNPKNILFEITIRAIGFITLPTLIPLALIANLTMGLAWGDDCLGYTVRARRG